MPHRPTARTAWTITMLLGLVCATAIGSVAANAADAPTQPAQPADGPGGVARLYPSFQRERFGNRPTGYWLYEPLDAAGNVPSEPLPLVIFLHGFMAVDPDLYGAWIEHIAQGGAIVIVPDYQTINPLTLRPNEYQQNAESAIADALSRLGRAGHTSFDSSRVAVVGHSAGGVLAANYAATAAQKGLPVPSVLMPVEPGGCEGCSGGLSGRFGIELADLSTIGPATRAIVIAGDADHVVGTEAAHHIWESMTSLQPGHRDFVLIQSDDHGKPALTANHLMPLTGFIGTTNALDWYGPWKLLDGLMDCAFDGLGCDQAMGGTEFQTFMGTWSDGVPVNPAVVEPA